ncbi:hypothetical protein PM082_003809 [Marasmius tenuissimus]|nr:hypothetical protein PM082_003809 [Marasmius tenuissimus]
MLLCSTTLFDSLRTSWLFPRFGEQTSLCRNATVDFEAPIRTYQSEPAVQFELAESIALYPTDFVIDIAPFNSPPKSFSCLQPVRDGEERLARQRGIYRLGQPNKIACGGRWFAGAGILQSRLLLLMCTIHRHFSSTTGRLLQLERLNLDTRYNVWNSSTTTRKRSGHFSAPPQSKGDHYHQILAGLICIRSTVSDLFR